MKYEIEYEETITKINSITIEVEDEDEGIEIANLLYDGSSLFSHPDDIINELDNMGVTITEVCEGSEECRYEIL